MSGPAQPQTPDTMRVAVKSAARQARSRAAALAAVLASSALVLLSAPAATQTKAWPCQRRTDRREAHRRRRQHLHQPESEGRGRGAAAESAEGRAVRGVLRGLLQPQRRPLAVRAQGHRAGLRLRDRRQGRPHRHQQPRHRRRRRNHRQLQRRLQAQGREGPRQGYQDRSRAAEGRRRKGRWLRWPSARPGG